MNYESSKHSVEKNGRSENISTFLYLGNMRNLYPIDNLITSLNWRNIYCGLFFSYA